MTTKMKGLYKGFKYISQIFADMRNGAYVVVVKEREMEIGYPTDVKHVAHIGWDGHSGSAPSWMSEFKAAPDFTTSIGNPRDSSNDAATSSWCSQDFDQTGGHQPISGMFQDVPMTDPPKIPKKPKRKKKSTSSPSSSSSRSSRTANSRNMFVDMDPKRNLPL